MSIEIIYDPSKLHPYELGGTLIKRRKLYGVVNNYPLRRKAVNFETLEMYKSRDLELRVYVRDDDSVAVNIAGATVVMTLRVEKGDTELVLAKTGSIGSPDVGEAIFTFIPSDTSQLEARQYVFDVAVTLSNGKKYNVLEGIINLLQPVG